MSKLQQVLQIQQYIAEGNISAAITLLQESTTDNVLESIILAISAQWNNLKKELRLGVVAVEQEKTQKSKIVRSILELTNEIEQQAKKNISIFISHDRGNSGQQLATNLGKTLRQNGFTIFISQVDLPIGAHVPTATNTAIQESKYFILLLSEQANTSKLVVEEVKTVYEQMAQIGLPIILPIRVQFPLSQPLNSNFPIGLSQINCLSWNKAEDKDIIANKLLTVLSEKVAINIQQEDAPIMPNEVGLPPIPRIPLEVPQGSVRIDSAYYITRERENELIQHIEQKAAIVRIRAPRQYGKTSLLHRMMNHAYEQNYTVIPIDFQEFSDATLGDLNQLLFEFCLYIAREFDLEEKFQTQWDRSQTKQTCTRFIEREVLRRQDHPILVAIDEADRLFQFQAVSKDFFLLLRSWHERSKIPMREMWDNFRLALSYSTEVKLAIQDLNASPFNVGKAETLSAFTDNQVSELAKRHHLTFSVEQLSGIKKLLAGQPFLVRRAFYLLANKNYDYSTLVADADEVDGPYGEHLRHLNNLVEETTGAKETLENILLDGKCHQVNMGAMLKAAGIVGGEHPKYELANDLYKRFFKKVI